MSDQGPGGAIVRFEEYSADDFDRDVAKAKAISGGALLELQDGENVVRFIPSRAPGVTPMRSTGMHFVDAIPGLDQTVVFACPKQELSQPCPVCLQVEELRRSPNPVDRQRADRIAVKLRVYANVVDRMAPADDPQHGLRVFGFGKSILEQLKTIRRNERFGGDFFQPAPHGFDIVIVKEGELLKTKYKVVPDRQPRPLHDDPVMAQALIDNQYDLNQYVNATVPEDIVAALQMTRASYGLPRAGAAATPAQSAWMAQQPAHVAAAVVAAQPASKWPAAAGAGAPAPAAARVPVGSGLFAQAPPASRVIVPGSSAARDVDLTAEAAPVNWGKVVEAETPEYDEDFNLVVRK